MSEVTIPTLKTLHSLPLHNETKCDNVNTICPVILMVWGRHQGTTIHFKVGL